MQSVFLDNLIKVTGQALHGPAYFPPLTEQGTMFAQMFSSSPSGGSESMQLIIDFVAWANRPWTEKFAEHWSRLIASQL